MGSVPIKRTTAVQNMMVILCPRLVFNVGKGVSVLDKTAYLKKLKYAPIPTAEPINAAITTQGLTLKAAVKIAYLPTNPMVKGIPIIENIATIMGNAMSLLFVPSPAKDLRSLE